MFFLPSSLPITHTSSPTCGSTVANGSASCAAASPGTSKDTMSPVVSLLSCRRSQTGGDAFEQRPTHLIICHVQNVAHAGAAGGEQDLIAVDVEHRGARDAGRHIRALHLLAKASRTTETMEAGRQKYGLIGFDEEARSCTVRARAARGLAEI